MLLNIQNQKIRAITSKTIIGLKCKSLKRLLSSKIKKKKIKTERESDTIDTKRIRLFHVSLTYSTVDRFLSEENITRQFIFDELKNKKQFDQYMIGLENHKNGERHFHVVLSFKKQLNQPMNFFAIKDLKTNLTSYPNVEYANPLWIKVLYCMKEDTEYLTNYPIEEFQKRKEKSDKGNLLNQVTSIYETEGYTKAIAFFKLNSTTNQKVKFTTRIFGILNTLEKMGKKITDTIAQYNINDFYKLEIFEYFILNDYSKTSGPGSIIIAGTPNSGKTNYIQAFLTSIGLKWILIGDFEELKKYEDTLHEYDFIIFDDVDFSRFKTHEDFLKLFEHVNPTSIPCRHYNPTIPAGVGRIFLTNRSFFEILNTVKLTEDQSIIRRVKEHILIYYLSPKIKENKNTATIKYNFKNITNYNITNSNNNEIIINHNTQPREFSIPTYNSFENKIINIDDFAKKQIEK